MVVKDISYALIYYKPEYGENTKPAIDGEIISDCSRKILGIEMSK